MITAIMFGIFLIFLGVGVPIAASVGWATLSVNLLDPSFACDAIYFVKTMANGMDSYVLLAVPLFMLSSSIMAESGLSGRLFNVFSYFFGNLPAGLPIAVVITCLFYGAICGSGPATVAAIGTMCIPLLTKLGYDKDFVTSMIAVAGGLGVIIPPSIPMVIYGVSGQQSISKMFMAGIIPGILIAVGLSVMHFFLCRNLKTEGLDWSMKTFIHSLRDGFWSILAPVIILGGIYAGIFTPTEAAVVAIFYTILVGIFIHKELTLKSFMASLKTTSWLTGRVLVLVFTATAFGYLLTSYRIPVEIANWILSFTNNVNLVWFFVVILLLFLGMFMETLAIIMLVTPVLLPIMTAYGVDPIHFGIILICCCGIGFSTPPLGENMFIASGIANISLEEISLKALPLVAINIAVIAILVMFPDIVLFLPNLMGTGLQ